LPIASFNQISQTMPLSFPTRPSFVAYVTCGDPDLSTTRDVILAAIEAGADVIELGVPFSDPVADGPAIQRASQRGLQQGTTLTDVLKLAAEVRQYAQSTGLIIFSYLNPILRMGLEKFCKVARHAGVDGALLTDLPVEEAGDYLREIGSSLSGGAHQHGRAFETDCGSVERISLCGLSNRSDWSSTTVDSRCAKTSSAPTQVHEAPHCRWFRYFDCRAICGLRRIR